MSQQTISSMIYLEDFVIGAPKLVRIFSNYTWESTIACDPPLIEFLALPYSFQRFRVLQSLTINIMQTLYCNVHVLLVTIHQCFLLSSCVQYNIYQL